MNVLSLFDGMSCGQIALDQLGVKVDNFYASEIDKFAIQVTQKNYPGTIQLGDITKWKDWEIDWENIDLIFGGSPCQGFSFAGKQLAFNDPRSKLFFVFIEILEYIQLRRKIANKPGPLFLLENVRMKKEYIDVITSHIKVDPMMINSALVSAQNRVRFYWTNINGLKQPEDKGINWGDIKEHNAPLVHYYSDKALNWITRHEKRTGKKLKIWGMKNKCQMLEASMHKNYSSQRFFGIEDVNGLRYISLLECERAQTVPEGYTEGVSNTQRYRMLGNGWTVEVIKHIFKNI